MRRRSRLSVRHARKSCGSPARRRCRALVTTTVVAVFVGTVLLGGSAAEPLATASCPRPAAAVWTVRRRVGGRPRYMGGGPAAWPGAASVEPLGDRDVTAASSPRPAAMVWTARRRVGGRPLDMRDGPAAWPAAARAAVFPTPPPSVLVWTVRRRVDGRPLDARGTVSASRRPTATATVKDAVGSIRGDGPVGPRTSRRPRPGKTGGRGGGGGGRRTERPGKNGRKAGKDGRKAGKDETDRRLRKKHDVVGNRIKTTVNHDDVDGRHGTQPRSLSPSLLPSFAVPRSSPSSAPPSPSSSTSSPAPATSSPTTPRAADADARWGPVPGWTPAVVVALFAAAVVVLGGYCWRRSRKIAPQPMTEQLLPLQMPSELLKAEEKLPPF